MGVYYSLAYGVALTDQFGEQLDNIPDELFGFGRAERMKKDSLVRSMPTEESPFIVLGVAVDEGASAGETWIEGKDTLKEIHERYLTLLQACPEHIRVQVEEEGLVPRLCVLAGDF